jgi:hypothetical protein
VRMVAEAVEIRLQTGSELRGLLGSQHGTSLQT